MTDSHEIFSLSAGTDEQAWLHGQAAARAWFTGSADATDGLDVVGEFDAKVSAELSADVARSLASVQAEGAAGAHAGLRLQVGLPLDIFTAAGLVARLRAEASASAQVTVTAKLSAVELSDLCLAPLPELARPYAQIVLEEGTVSAGVWARGSFAAMASAELVSTVVLFPTDGSPPGVTAFLRYGYAWGWGGGWGTVVNVGLEPERLVSRLGGQAGADIRIAIAQTHDDPTISDLDRWLLGVLPSFIPAVLGLVTHLALLTTRDDHTEAEVDQALSEFVAFLREALVSWLIDGLFEALQSEVAAIDVEGVGTAARKSAWDVIDALTAARVQTPGDDSGDLEAVLAALRLVGDLVDAVGSGLSDDARKALASLLRCSAAVAVLVGPAIPRASLAGLFPDQPPTDTPVEIALDVLSNELVKVLSRFTVVPDWLETLLGSTGALVRLVTEWGTGDAAEEQRLVVDLIHTLLDSMEQGGIWDEIEASLPTPIRPAVRGLVAVLDEYCAAKQRSEATDVRFREGVTVCVLALVGEPLADLLSIVANKGLRAAPDAFRQLADLVDVGDFPPSLTWSWQELGESVVGVVGGLPTATVLRKTAATVDNWCETILPEELHFLETSLRLGSVCDRIPTQGTAKAVGDFKEAFLGELAAHAGKHVLYSLEFSHREGLELLEAAVTSSLEILVRSLEVSAIAAFKVFEESIRLSEAAAVGAQKRVDDLEKELAQGLAQLVAEIRDVATTIANEADQLEHALTALLLKAALGLGADRGVASDVLTVIVRAGIGAATGGLNAAVADLARRMAQVLDVTAEGLAAAASSANAPRGLRGLFQSAASSGPMPHVSIPVSIPIPNPFLPGVLPGIDLYLFSIDVPSEVVGQIALTALFDSVGIGPLLDALDGTAVTLSGIRVALDQATAVKDDVAAGTQRAALDAAQPSKPLDVEFISPEQGAATGSTGAVVFRIRGANSSFVDPGNAGLPPSMPRRVDVRLNGRVVTEHVDWREVANGLEGTLRYSAMRDDGGTVFASPPTFLAVAVVGTYQSPDSASGILMFVPVGLPRLLHADRIAYETGHSRIAKIGGGAGAKAWLIGVDDAIRLLGNGTRILLGDDATASRHLSVSRSRAGRRYLRASGRGRERLDALPVVVSR